MIINVELLELGEVEAFVLDFPHPFLPRKGEMIEVTDTVTLLVESITYRVRGYRRHREEANSNDIVMQVSVLKPSTANMDWEEWREIVRRLHLAPNITPDDDKCACCGYDDGRMGVKA